MTVGLGEYVAGAAELVVVAGAAAFAATRVRARLLPGWTGAPARLAEIDPRPRPSSSWSPSCSASSPSSPRRPSCSPRPRRGSRSAWRCRAWGTGSERPRLRRGACAARAVPAPIRRSSYWSPLGIVALLFAHWGFETQQILNNAITNFDSRWYHLPFAAEFAQSGSTTELVQTDPLFLNWFYPAGLGAPGRSHDPHHRAGHARPLRQPRLAGPRPPLRLVRRPPLRPRPPRGRRRSRPPRGPQPRRPRAGHGQERRRRRRALPGSSSNPDHRVTTRRAGGGRPVERDVLFQKGVTASRARACPPPSPRSAGRRADSRPASPAG